MADVADQDAFFEDEDALFGGGSSEKDQLRLQLL